MNRHFKSFGMSVLASLAPLHGAWAWGDAQDRALTHQVDPGSPVAVMGEAIQRYATVDWLLTSSSMAVTAGILIALNAVVMFFVLGKSQGRNWAIGISCALCLSLFAFAFVRLSDAANRITIADGVQRIAVACETLVHQVGDGNVKSIPTDLTSPIMDACGRDRLLDASHWPQSQVEFVQTTTGTGKGRQIVWTGIPRH